MLGGGESGAPPGSPAVARRLLAASSGRPSAAQCCSPRCRPWHTLSDRVKPRIRRKAASITESPPAGPGPLAQGAFLRVSAIVVPLEAMSSRYEGNPTRPHCLAGARGMPAFSQPALRRAARLMLGALNVCHEGVVRVPGGLLMGAAAGVGRREQGLQRATLADGCGGVDLLLQLGAVGGPWHLLGRVAGAGQQDRRETGDGQDDPARPAQPAGRPGEQVVLIYFTYPPRAGTATPRSMNRQVRISRMPSNGATNFRYLS